MLNIYNNTEKRRYFCQIVFGEHGKNNSLKSEKPCYFETTEILYEIPLNGSGRVKARKKVQHELSRRGLWGKVREINILKNDIIDEKGLLSK